MVILHLVREWAEARNATPARRTYGYITAAVLVATLAWITVARAPVWPFWAVVAVGLVIDIILVRHWMRQDLLNRARAKEEE